MNKNSFIDLEYQMLFATRKAVKSFSEMCDRQSILKPRILISTHTEKKLISWVLMLKESGFTVCVYPSHPSSVCNEASKIFDDEKILYIERKEDLINKHDLNKLINFNPEIIFDDGALIFSAYNDNPTIFPSLIGGTEFTTTGSNTLDAIHKKDFFTPVFDVGHSFCKYVLCNGSGTGLTTFTSILEAVNISPCNKKVYVIGYGEVGAGVARYFRINGSKVCVYDSELYNLGKAYFDGHDIDIKKEKLNTADIVITCSGVDNSLDKDNLILLKNHALIANVGCFNSEIDIPFLKNNSNKIININNHLQKFIFKGKSIYLLSEGNLVNISFGNGWPIENIDLCFALSTICFRELIINHSSYKSFLPIPKKLEKEALQMFFKGKKLTL